MANLSTNGFPPLSPSGRGLLSRARHTCPVQRPPALLVPDWDAETRELWLGGLLVKRFSQPADWQELILAAFQEQEWTLVIDDPLPGGDGVIATHRLRQIIKNLNRAQKQARIQFSAIRNGTGIRWDLPV
jgi:hypothetical protein